MAVRAKVERETGRDKAIRRISPTDVPAEGHPIRVQWSRAAGATESQITSASIAISPAVLEKNLGTLPMSQDGNDRVVTVPADVRIRALTLSGLKLDGDAPAPSVSELSAHDRRLAITLDTGGPRLAPQHAVPACPARGMVPASLTGASYGNRVLALPDVAAARIRLALVSGSFPEEFTGRAMTLAGVSGLGAVLPRNLSLVEPDGTTVVWSFPNEMPPGTPDLTIDLAPSLTKLIAAALRGDEPLDFTYRLKGDSAARVFLSFSGARGALLRSFPGVLEHTLEGAPVAVALDAKPPLAAELPARASADLAVTYAGIRLLESVSDAVPAAPGDISGVVVDDVRRVRAFPPKAFDLFAPARIGVVGRAPVECELSIQLVEMRGEEAGAVVAAGVARPSASNAMSTVWIELPAMKPPARALGCAVRATQGRFLWAAGERPLVRVAVHDPDPGGRPLLLNGQPLLSITRNGTATPAAAARPQPIRRPGFALPAPAFRASVPRLSSDLFLKVDLSDLTLAYAR